MASKIKSYLGRNWKRLVISNLVSFAIQGVALAILLKLGCPGLVAVVTAKGLSWGQFLAVVAMGK